MNNRGLRSLAQAIERFRSFNDAIPARLMHTFIVVANWPQEEGPTMGELATATGLERPVVSRHVGALLKHYKLGKPGLDLVDKLDDPVDPRRTRVVLTQKGKTLRHQLIQTMEK